MEKDLVRLFFTDNFKDCQIHFVDKSKERVHSEMLDLWLYWKRKQAQSQSSQEEVRQ
ncbi:hypothetical protein [Brevibacillus brevis]|uniref:hypothetical protein n=1 Tax=Brevibacillus brevis TaxID=1393 RepID=UPI000E367473|nr:hypothetical protein [Brevibacillus brevis]RED28452.1 hypothetical protein DES34_108319 [Brevibacillus brevis]GEC90707.1 hypothetical protein BBR01nite_30380 [Brevibacillus brevis]VEF91147.1 Uncharacterised protein [Brevibacillus brevis]